MRIEHAVPTFLGAALSDTVVNPTRNTQALANALGASGTPVTLKLYDRTNHMSLIGTMAWPLRWLAPVLDDVAASWPPSPPPLEDTKSMNIPFRADQVGSLLRPPSCGRRARSKRGETRRGAALKAHRRPQPSARPWRSRRPSGLQSITDGEFRRDWWHMDFLAGSTA